MIDTLKKLPGRTMELVLTLIVGPILFIIFLFTLDAFGKEMTERKRGEE